MEKMDQLGFPVPLLGMQPVRLPVLHDDGELLVIVKPANVLVQSESWYPRMPVLIEAIRHQAQEGKPEFQRLSIAADGLWAVTDLDPECYGPVVFARSRQKADELRSSFGSREFNFSYKFLCRGGADTSELECDLPLARHRHEKKMLVTHTTGKKAFTRFEKLGSAGPAEIWTGQTNYPRRHQLLIHPMESRLPVLGDSKYAREKVLMLSRLKKNYQPKKEQDERPLYEGPAYYLAQIKIPGGITVNCPEPPRWKGLLMQLEKSSRI